MDVRTAARETLRRVRHLVAGMGTAALAVTAYLLLPVVALAAVGMPVMPVVVSPLRGLAGLERRRTEAWVGRPVRRTYPTVHGTPADRSRAMLRDPATRAELVWVVVHGLLGFVLPALAVGLLVAFVVTVTLPLWWWMLPPGTLTLLAAPIENWLQALVLPLATAALLALVLRWFARLATSFQTSFAESMLGSRPAAAVRIRELTDSRAGALAAHEAELGRIERDLHDGTQAQLVTVAMRLGLVERSFDTDPAAARRLLREARETVDGTLVELRGVIRGIHPPILTDRGLEGAIRSLVAGRAAPVDLDVDLGGVRPPAAVEAAAYFVVAEALTNVARHSAATRSSVTVRRDGAALLVTVSDDGRGGADLQQSTGTGLLGIRRRVAALDGTTRVTSPAGAGTTIEVVLPCAS